jgi:hypothetical protein
MPSEGHHGPLQQSKVIEAEKSQANAEKSQANARTPRGRECG